MKRTLKILKKMLIGILAITVFVVLVAAVFVNTSPEFGGKPTGTDLEKIENSPNYNGDGTFKNQELTLATTGVKWSSFLKFFTNGDNKVPEEQLPQQNLTPDYFETEPVQPRVTWFGHSAIFLERTVVASRCENVVAGAGSVKSSAGT